MSLNVICPSCGNSLKAPAEHAGRRAKCPKCGGSITIAGTKREAPPAARTSAPPKKAASVPSPAQSTVSPAIAQPRGEKRAKSPQPRKYSRSHIVGSAFLALVAGYVAGSYHPMNQMYSRFVEASKAVIDSYRLPPGGIFGETLDVTDSDEGSIDLRDRIRMAAQGFDEEPSLLEIGDEYEAEGFSLTLTEARFAHAEVPATDGQSPLPGGATTLICTFLLTNTDEQSIPSPAGRQALDPRTFSIRNSTGERIRDIQFVVTSVGEGTSQSGDIPPGDQRAFIANFTIPRPSAEHVILSINLEAFGGEGRVRFDIPAPDSDDALSEDS